ncbi:MAG: DUF2793 domain-containing protein [Hyphomicrobiaceae bacterium]
MDQTPNLALPFILAAQAQKHVTHNEAIRALDAVVQLAVLDRDLSAPPPAPADGDRYLVASGASGAWSGQDGRIAAFQDNAWAFHAPREGWVMWIADEEVLAIWDGSAWLTVGAGGSALQGLTLVGINGTADTTNRLVVASDATLLTHDGAGHQHKINKATAGDTASLLLQTGFSGRAEIGLAGDDDLHVKVSADGTTWREAMVIERATGIVSLPLTPELGAASRTSLLHNGSFRINQRAFAGGALAAGSFGHDRWKADAGGVSYSVSGETVTIASGRLTQTVEPGASGLLSLASQDVTISVEDLTGGALFVSVAAVSGTISAGSGRRSLTLSLGSGATGNVVVTIGPDSTAVSFRRLKLEQGSAATTWQPVDHAQELARCHRYFQRLTSINFNVGDDPSVPRNWGVVNYRELRQAPVVSITAGGLLGQHGIAPAVAIGPFSRNVVLQYTGSAYRVGFNSVAFVSLDVSADL